MPQGWQWDPTLFKGCAAYYLRGRLPYPEPLAQVMCEALSLDGRGRLLDVGCGPGSIALNLTLAFTEVVGVDPDPEMLAVAAGEAEAMGITNARWRCLRAEQLPADLGLFDVATFAASFHWMDREQVAATMHQMLVPGGAFVQVSMPQDGRETADGPLPFPPPPRAAVRALVAQYLGPERRAGQGYLRHGTPGNETAVVEGAGFAPPEIFVLPGGHTVERSIDDEVAAVLSNSGSAPHLFGDRLPAFETELRSLLAAAADAGRFAVQTADCEVRIWKKRTNEIIYPTSLMGNL